MPSIQDIENVKKRAQELSDNRARAEGALEAAYQQLEQLTGTRCLKEADAMLVNLEKEEEQAKVELAAHWEALQQKYGDLVGAV